MFLHQGKSRTLKHNLQIASVLSFVAGMVNVTGVLAFHELTTNVTGHFALFINDLANFNLWKGLIYFLYILSFLGGAFTSSLLIEKYRENKRLNVYLLPTIIEALLLFSIPLLILVGIDISSDTLACIMLFSMGLQNSFVTKISNAVVRTTHLTGLFTDLGIDLSMLLFKKRNKEMKIIRSNIQLRLVIIGSFFGGGLFGGFLFSELNFMLNTLFVASGILMISLYVDDLRFRRQVSQ